MTRAWLRIPALLWLGLWFAVIVPAHQRGQIVIPGTDKTVVFTASCCASRQTPVPGSRHTPGPSPARIANCAICHLAARTDLPTVIHLDLPPLGFIGILPCFPPINPESARFTPLSRDRGPPLAA